jgi:hypothetical protein
MSARARISLVSFKVLLLAACAVSQTIDASPTNASGLLRNLRRGLDEGLFLQPAFYADESLARFFGSSQSEWLVRAENKQSVTLSGLTYLPARKPGDSRIGLMRYITSASDARTDQRKFRASVSVICSCELRIADIDAVFGTDQKAVIDERQRAFALQMPNLPAPPPASDPMGNKRVTYFDTDGHCVPR